MIGIADYQMYRSNLTNYSPRDQTQQIQTQHQTGTYARGSYYGISILIPYKDEKKHYKFTHNTREKI